MSDTPPPPASGAGLTMEVARDAWWGQLVRRGDPARMPDRAGPFPAFEAGWAALSASRTSAATGWEDITVSEVEAEIERLCYDEPDDYPMDRGERVLLACNAIARHRLAGEQATGGAGLDRDYGGRLVREAWVRWALTQPNPKPTWLVPYDDLGEPDKEADRQIAEALWSAHPAPAPGGGGEVTIDGAPENATRPVWVTYMQIVGDNPPLPFNSRGDWPAVWDRADAPTPDAPDKPGQGGEGARLKTADREWLGRALVIAKQSYASDREAAQARAERILAFVDAAPPADAALREALVNARRVYAMGEGHTNRAVVSALDMIVRHAAEFATLAPSAPPSPADGAPGVEG